MTKVVTSIRKRQQKINNKIHFSKQDKKENKLC